MSDNRSLDLAQACASLALDKKGEDPSIIHVEGVTSYTDYFVVVSAKSERQVSAIASAIEDGLRDCGVKPLGVEGKESGAWVLLDYGEVVVHLYLEDARAYYDLEGLWADAPRVDVSEDDGVLVRKAWEQVHRDEVAARREAL